MFNGLLVIADWIAVGYFLRAHNYWASLAFSAFALVLGLTNSLQLILGGQNDRHSSKPE